MTWFSRYLSALSAGMLAAGIFIGLAPVASANHDVYPRGWDTPQNVPPPMYDFRSGKGWNDYQRYAPGDVSHGSGAKSQPMTYGPTIYQMVPGGSQYHRVTGASTPHTDSPQSQSTKQAQ
jgi:hypothetical protein